MSEIDRNEEELKRLLKKGGAQLRKRLRDSLGSENRHQRSDSGQSLVLPGQVLPPNLFILPVSTAVVYPSLMAPIVVSEPRFIQTVEEAIKNRRLIGIVLTKQHEVDSKTSSKDLYSIGVVGKIIKRLKLPDGSINLLIHSVQRFKISKSLSETPHIVLGVKYVDDVSKKSMEMDALTRSVISQVKKLSEINPFFTDEMKLAMLNAPGPGTVADLVAFALALPKEEAQDFLEILDVKKRFEKLLVHLRKEQDVADLQKKIQDDVNSKINTMQREFFLKEQLKVIKRELGSEEDGTERSKKTFREQILEAKMPKEAEDVALRELEKLETISEQSPEYNVARNYLETIVALPWNKETEDNFDLDRARKILDKDHYGLEKVKDRIIEFLAVKSLTKNKKSKGSIICLVGPPGVGKTSTGKSIAKTMGRKFYRFSLGGMRDEAEIKGHRRTYVGAMPGKIIEALKRSGSKNSVIMLDEIDKLGQSFQGDPASALLEVLDPEQNSTFVDHFMDVPFDLSNVLFVCTANSVSTIPGPLLDRMELIELPGYTLEEKVKIANRYVIPEILAENGIKPSQLKISPSGLKLLMSDYAREPGLRTVQKAVERIARKEAAKIVANKRKKMKPTLVTDKNISDWLGPKRFYNELAERITSPGVVVGLAWTSMGGDILFIEASEIPGNGKLKLTGQMGEVMAESAAIAWSVIKKRLANEWKNAPKVLEASRNLKVFSENDFHLHIPAGAIPKDGPSAGITMAAALYSLLTGKKAKEKLAMTGELSLIGKVLPVGGIKEKMLAAKRVGIKTIVLPKQNKKDLAEIPSYVTRGLKLHWVENLDEVLKLTLA